MFDPPCGSGFGRKTAISRDFPFQRCFVGLALI